MIENTRRLLDSEDDYMTGGYRDIRKRIDESHPFYKEFIELTRAGTHLSAHFFDSSPSLFKEYNENPAENEAPIRDIVSRTLCGDMDVLCAFADAAHAELPELSQRLSEVINLSLETKQPVDALKIQKLILGAPLEKILEINERRLHAFERFIDEQVEGLKLDFLNDIQECIAVQKLPIAFEEVKRRIQNVKVKAVDGFVAPGFLIDVGGIYSSQSDTIYIPSWTDMEWIGGLRATMFHEFIHVISGKGMYAEFTEDSQTPLNIDIDRIGLHFGPGNRFHWLNEAVTESFNKEILGIKGETCYTDQINLYNELCAMAQQKGVDLKKIILDTYFENDNIQATPRVPAWHAFAKSLSEIFSKGFLIRLDDYVKQYGPQEAFEAIRTGVVQ